MLTNLFYFIKLHSIQTVRTRINKKKRDSVSCHHICFMMLEPHDTEICIRVCSVNIVLLLNYYKNKNTWKKIDYCSCEKWYSLTLVLFNHIFFKCLSPYFIYLISFSFWPEMKSFKPSVSERLKGVHYFLTRSHLYLNLITVLNHHSHFYRTALESNQKWLLLYKSFSKCKKIQCRTCCKMDVMYLNMVFFIAFYLFYLKQYDHH